MDEESRRILRRAATPPERLGDLAMEYFGANGVELELPPREPHAPMNLYEECGLDVVDPFQALK